MESEFEGLPSVLVKMCLERDDSLKNEEDVLFEALYRLLPENRQADIVDGKIIVYNTPSMPIQQDIHSCIHLYDAEAGHSPQGTRW
jgi:hypothetical protein